MKVLVTGVAGFIGYHLAKRLLKDGFTVIGIDNLNHYYDVRLKLDRLNELGVDESEIALGKRIVKSQSFDFYFSKLDLTDYTGLNELFDEMNFDLVFNMAAQAGVRYSIEQPKTYVDSNLVGFANLLEACRIFQIKHLIYASSSSVYGNTTEIPFKTTDNVDAPISFYAATKKCNELMAHSYSHLFNIPTTGLRFFTVYGEWGRPDMAIMLFTKAILNNKPIKVFNHGKMMRDFTYIGDIVEGIMKVINRTNSIDAHSRKDDGTSNYKIFNIGNGKPVNLMSFIEELEIALGTKAIKEMYPMQPGDVEMTYADVSELINDYDYRPNTSIKEGVKNFVFWYKKYFKV